LDVATAGQSAAVAFSAELDQRPGRSQQEERLTVRFDDGRVEEMRLHEYGRVYSVPGLYEDVVQRQLACASPSELAGALAREVEAERASLADLRVLDVGAGNGVVGEELRRHGLREPLIGLDNEPEAGRAAERDRPGLYADYLTGGLDDFPIASLVEEHALNCLVGAGALGLGHISAASFDAAWHLPTGIVACDHRTRGGAVRRRWPAGRVRRRSQKGRARHRRPARRPLSPPGADVGRADLLLRDRGPPHRLTQTSRDERVGGPCPG
jgi:hypothetical protein